MVTDPGIVKVKTESNDDDGSATTVCKKCEAQRPHSQVNHCSYCNHCVDLFDHHCIWVSNCIGLNNFPSFLGYLHGLFWLTGLHLAVLAFTFETVNKGQ